MRIHRLIIIVSALLLGACGGVSRPLPNSHESPEALARAVLAAVERRDVQTLHRLALDKDEFETNVWSELPAARPERNLTVNYVWGDLNQKSNSTMRRTLAAHGGKKYDVVSIRFSGETTPYETFRVHRESELTVKGPDGAERQIRVFGSMIEKGGRYKVFSYVVDD
jgi:hypothetical protein